MRTLTISQRLNETVALQLVADLALIDLGEDVCVDFSDTVHFEPFAMLLVSSAINRLRTRAAASGRAVTVVSGRRDGEDIAGHMGFWQSVGLAIGRETGATPHRDTYLPITRIGVDEIYEESAHQDPLGSGVIEAKANQLARILSPASDELTEALTYCLRELIRNVLEHAFTPALWLAGMSWPKRDFVQVAVLDEGQGVRASLATHKQFQYETDLDALRAALREGVSRNLGRRPSAQRQERLADERHQTPHVLLDNAGYGLYMISSLCREAGQFLLASGNAYVAYVSSGEISGATGHHGTALRLVLQPSEVPRALDAVFSGDFARGPAAKKPLLSASKLRSLGFGKLANGLSDKPKPRD